MILFTFVIGKSDLGDSRQVPTLLQGLARNQQQFRPVQNFKQTFREDAFSTSDGLKLCKQNLCAQWPHFIDLTGVIPAKEWAISLMYWVYASMTAFFSSIPLIKWTMNWNAKEFLSNRWSILNSMYVFFQKQKY